MIIDAHTHLLGTGHWPQEWWDWVAADWAASEPGRDPATIRGRIEGGLIDPGGHRMVSRMDEVGIDQSVVLPIDWGPDFTAEQPITAVVDDTLELGRAYPDRLIPFGGIDPRRPGAVELVTDWFERGIRGLKLYPSCGWDPTCAEAMEIYRVCEERRAPVLFHTGEPLPLLDAERSDPLLLKEVAQAFPELPIWLGHAGAPRWWAEALEVAAAGPRVRLEMSVWLWDDSDEEAQLGFTRRVLEAADAVGFERLVFGTDHVSGAKVRLSGFLGTVTGMYRRLPEHARRLGATVTDDQMASLMGGAAAADLSSRP